MSVDYHSLLWQQLNKAYAGTDQAFVMTTGMFPLYSDYSLSDGNAKIAEMNTFELTDRCIACGTNYNPTGAKISLLWDQLLNYGKGPPAGPELEPAFKNARDRLYKAYIQTSIKMKYEYQEKYGDDWEKFYDEGIRATPEYKTWEKLNKEVTPLLKAINEWVYGPLQSRVIEPMRMGTTNYRHS